MKLQLTVLLFFIFNIRCSSQTVILHPTFNSMGVEVQLPTSYDTDKTAHCYFEYRKLGTVSWLKGFESDRISINGDNQFRGSLFNLDSATVYEVKVTLKDSIPIITSQILTTIQGKTLLPPTFPISGIVKWVSPTGTGTTYTQSNPGNLKTLVGSGGVTCGTTIILKDGNYSDERINFNITTNCSPTSRILFIADVGAHPVINGGDSTSITTWNISTSDPNLYSSTLPAGLDYTNLCLLNGKWLYPYPSLDSNILVGGFNLRNLSFGWDGFVRDNSTIRIKTATGVNPNTKKVILSRAFRGFTVYGNNRNAYLTFKGITFKYIAKSKVTGTTTNGAIAVDLRDVSNVTFDNCQFIYNVANITTDGQCDSILIQNCYFKNENGLITHGMSKKSNVEYIGVAGFGAILTSYRRSYETAALNFTNTKHLIVRNNRFVGMNSAIVSDFNVGLIEEVDFYNNICIDNSDAVECDNNWCNLRVWNNEIIRPMAGFSIAPPNIGPRYFYRNTIHHMTGRTNTRDEPKFNDCSPSGKIMSAAIGIKTNSSHPMPNPGNLYFINNTFYSEDSLGFLFTLWDAEWKQAYFANNIYYDKTKHIGYFHDLESHSTFPLESNRDNYYSDNSSAPLMVAKRINGLFNCVSIYDLDSIQPVLQSIAGCSDYIVSSPLNADPLFVSTANGGFELTSSSPMIDSGIIIKGFYDYSGNSPDIGAKEFQQITSITEHSSEFDLSIYPNPTSNFIYILNKQNVSLTSYFIYSSVGVLTMNGSLENETIDCSSLSNGVYFLKIFNSQAQVVVKRIIISK